MAMLLNYPVDDIKDKAEKDDKTNDEIIEEFYQTLRIHEKLCYDSFASLKELSQDRKTEVRRKFLRHILNQGWKKFLNQDDMEGELENDERLEKYDVGIKLENNIHKLTKQSQAKNYPSFEEAIKKLKQIFKDNLK